MVRPFESDMYVSSLTDSVLEFRSVSVLKPDVVTDAMANIAIRELNREQPTSALDVLELGVGAAPFLSQVARGVNHAIALKLHGIDIDESALPFAMYNTEKALAHRKNPNDELIIEQASWDKVIDGSGNFDCVYFNPPYLKDGEVVRSEFKDSPRVSMYALGSLDGLDHYRNLLPRIQKIMKPGGRLLVRTPRDFTRHRAILNIVQKSFTDAATIHPVVVEDELGLRNGRGFVVEFAKTVAKLYRIMPVRAVGLALVEQPISS